MTPLIRQRLAPKGYHLLHWGHAGWIQLFSKQPVKTLGDLKKSRLYTTEGNDRMASDQIPRLRPGCAVVSRHTSQLKTGVIDAVPAPPYGALALGVCIRTRNTC